MTERASFSVAPADLPSVRAAISELAEARYSESLVAERLGLEDLADLQWRPVPIYRAERLARRDCLDLAIDLFLLQGALCRDELASLFSGRECRALVDAGVLAVDETGAARARAGLFPVGERLIFSDHAWPELPHPGYSEVPSDQVMWIGMDSRHLARCTSRRPFASALDLCTGSGIHALLASTHAGKAVAVDINPRAVRCARFNAEVWGSGNLEVVAGDLYEPIGEERFDLITANPPFVPSPLNTLGFRDGGRSGEDILRRIVAGLPAHLAAGGIAQIITELGERDGEPLAARLRQWLNLTAPNQPMNIHILRLGEHTAMKYALGHAKGDDYQTFLDSVEEWSANLRAQGYARVVSVVISFEWSDGDAWEREDRSPPPRRPAGAEIDAAFLAERMARHPDCRGALKTSRVCRVGPIALLDAKVLGSGIEAKTRATLLGQALTMEHHLSPLEREILERVEGSVGMPDLIGSLGLGEGPVIEAAASLLRWRLIRIEPG
jgi:hypothetical protein